MSALTVGTMAPAFSAPDQSGSVRTLADFAGSWLLLYFYPKDDTTGCTAEACSLRDAAAPYRKRKIHVVGVSADSVKSHAKFAQKYALAFPLLADEEKKIVQAYGTWGEKSMYGKTYMGILRMSFLINPEGRIVKIYPAVKPEEHAAEVLADMDAMQ